MAVTINDVAKHAGVSHTTVSWVIHDDPRITPKTKEKVWKAIKELDYHPNIQARSLVRGKTNTIAVVAAFYSTNFEVSFLKGMEQSDDSDEHPYNINLYSTRGEPEVKDRILKEILYGKRADGVILLSINAAPELLMKFQQENVPVIMVEEESPYAHVIKMDNEQGAYLAVDALCCQGRKNIALVCGASNEENGASPRERQLGYEKALKEWNIPIKESNIYQLDDYYFEEGEKAYHSLIEKDPKIDGIFCAAGDVVAFGVMKAAIKDGKRIPEDIAVIGYDNIDVASMVSPPLSSVHQPIEGLGRSAYSMAVEALKNPQDEPKRVVLRPELVLRESS